MYIDSHQHFWKIKNNYYSWLNKKDHNKIYTNFMPENILPTLDQYDIKGSVVVQAAPCIEETYFMLDLAKKNDFIKAVIGWVDLLDINSLDLLQRLSKYNHFKGIRPMLHDIENSSWILNDQIKPVFKKLSQLNLVFELVIQQRHLKIVKEIIKENSQITFIINHCAKPNIKEKEKNVVCKVSGLVTEAGSNYTLDDLRPYMDLVFDVFGIDRVMWGSDYPVLNLCSSYTNWIELFFDYIDSFSLENKNKVMGLNACKIYNIF